MRVFVIGTGRTGSLTFARACAHATNYTAAHESRIARGADRLDYPDGHIEVDNRLSWFLGSLARSYPDAYYVHLTRDEDEVVRSYRSRLPDSTTRPRRLVRSVQRVLKGDHQRSIVWGFAHSIVPKDGLWSDDEVDDVVRLMVRTVEDNITEFLRHRPHMRIELATLPAQFGSFWSEIGATGDLDTATRELAVRHNASE